MPAPKNSPATFNIPLGPVHVALEEPVYFDLQVDGEIIRGATLHSGHVHRGMENLAQHRNLIMNQTLTELSVPCVPTAMPLPTPWLWKMPLA